MNYAPQGPGQGSYQPTTETPMGPAPVPQAAPVQQYVGAEMQMPADPSFGQQAQQPAPQQHVATPHQPQQQFRFDDGLPLSGPTAGFQTVRQQASQPISTMPGPQQQQPAPQPQPQQSLRDTLARAGLNVSGFQSDEQLVRELTNAQQERAQLQRLAQIGQQALAQQIQQPPQTNQQPAQTQPQSRQAPAEPEWRPEWGVLIEQDPATGMYRPKPGNEIVAAQIAQVANQREARRREMAEALLTDPVGYLKQNGLDQLFQEERQRWQQELEDRRRDEEAMRWVSDFRQRVTPMLYERDQAGKVLTNPLNGQPVLSEVGQFVLQQRQQIVQDFQAQYGIEPDDYFVERSLAPVFEFLAGRQQAPQPQQPPVPQAPQPQPTSTISAAMQQQPTYGAFYQPTSGGTIASAANNPTIPQNNSAGLREAFRQAAIQRGLTSADAWL